MERNIIQEVMDSNNISMHQMARLIEYDVAVLSRVKNRIQKMSHRMAYKISVVFNLDLDDIINVENV